MYHLIANNCSNVIQEVLLPMDNAKETKIKIETLLNLKLDFYIDCHINYDLQSSFCLDVKASYGIHK